MFCFVLFWSVLNSIEVIKIKLICRVFSFFFFSFSLFICLSFQVFGVRFYGRVQNKVLYIVKLLKKIILSPLRNAIMHKGTVMMISIHFYAISEGYIMHVHGFTIHICL